MEQRNVEAYASVNDSEYGLDNQSTGVTDIQKSSTLTVDYYRGILVDGR